jgi:hypothetical protein
VVKIVKSQWECVLQNLGEWQGSFTRLLPTGEEIEDTPSLISLTGVDDNRLSRGQATPTIHLALTRYYPDADGILTHRVQGRYSLRRGHFPKVRPICGGVRQVGQSLPSDTKIGG